MQSTIHAKPSTAAQSRFVRRLNCYTYSVSRAILWRNRSLLSSAYDAETRRRMRENMRESALRAAWWRNLMMPDAGQD